jgi:hypothetical protein
VAHRISEILESTTEKEWRWVPTTENIADKATKISKFKPSDIALWFDGPLFLKLKENEWPIQKMFGGVCQDEIRYVNVQIPTTFGLELQTQRFSNWWVLVRSVCLVFRFIRCLKGGRKNQKFLKYPFSAQEVTEAEMIIFKQAQFCSFAREISSLRQGKEIQEESSLSKLSPYLDDGLLRLEGRIDSASFVSFEQKRPIILPKDSWITHLLLMSYHKRFHHQVPNTVINEVRQRFYIPN